MVFGGDGGVLWKRVTYEVFAAQLSNIRFPRIRTMNFLGTVYYAGMKKKKSNGMRVFKWHSTA